MSRKTGVVAAFVLVIAAAALYLAHPTDVTLGIAVEPPGSSPPGPWSGP